MTRTAPSGIPSSMRLPEDQVNALEELTAMIADFGPTPCAGDTRFISDDIDVQTEAAEVCRDCYALAECGAYITAFPREIGVYGGMTERTRPHHHRGGE